MQDQPQNVLSEITALKTKLMVYTDKFERRMKKEEALALLNDKMSVFGLDEVNKMNYVKKETSTDLGVILEKLNSWIRRPKNIDWA